MFSLKHVFFDCQSPLVLSTKSTSIAAHRNITRIQLGLAKPLWVQAWEPQLPKACGVPRTLGATSLLWMDEIRSHQATMRHHCWHVVFTLESFQGFLDSGFRPSTASPAKSGPKPNLRFPQWPKLPSPRRVVLDVGGLRATPRRSQDLPAPQRGLRRAARGALRRLFGQRGRAATACFAIFAGRGG